MHKEVIKGNQLTPIHIVLYIAILFGVTLLVNIVLQRFGIPAYIKDLATFGIIIASVTILVYHGKIAYTYALISEEFIIKEDKHGKEVTLLNIHVNQIKSIEKGALDHRTKASLTEENCYIKAYKSIKNSYCCYYIEDGKEYCFQFQPSDKLRERLESYINE